MPIRPLPDQSAPQQVPAFLANAWSNRKTTVAGFIPIGLAVLDLLNQYSSGHWDPTHLQADLAAFGMGGGLIVASDAK